VRERPACAVRRRNRCSQGGAGARTIDGVNPDRPELRISDAEREQALEALNVHMANGRLDIDEYGERSAQIVAAKTRGDLVPIFRDLPDPHPEVLVSKLPEPERTAPPAASRPRGLADRFVTSAVPIAAIVAVVLFFFVARGFWPVFLLPAVTIIVIRAIGKQGYR